MEDNNSATFTNNRETFKTLEVTTISLSLSSVMALVAVVSTSSLEGMTRGVTHLLVLGEIHTNKTSAVDITTTTSSNKRRNFLKMAKTITL